MTFDERSVVHRVDTWGNPNPNPQNPEPETLPVSQVAQQATEGRLALPSSRFSKVECLAVSFVSPAGFGVSFGLRF